MSKYCPKCLNEFQESVKKCPTDSIALVKREPHEKTETYIDIYSASDEIEAERIVAFLNEAGLGAKISRSGISQVPVVGESKFLIAVNKSHQNKALDLIKNAVKDGVVSDNGNFI